MFKNNSKSLQIGRAGELRVIAELTMLGFNPLQPVFDDGIDVVMSNGNRIAIKTCRRPLLDRRNHAYFYEFKMRVIRRKGYYQVNYERLDFVILVCWEHNDFYVIPIKDFKKKYGWTIRICYEKPEQFRKYKKHKFYESQSKFSKYKNAWELLTLK